MPGAPRPASDAERLAALRSYDILDTAFEAAFDDLAEVAATLSGCPIALVSLVDAERQWFKARIGMEAAETPRDIAFCAHAILDPSGPLVVEDASRDPRFVDSALVTGATGIRFYAGAPLVNPEGHALGTLCVMDRVPRRMDEAQRRMLASLARAVMSTMELRRTALWVREMALTDALTGIANRPAFLAALGRAILSQRSDHRPFGLAYLDLDGFKRVNDLHGHAVGDSVLRAVAAAIRTCVRREDVAARLGGDEFGVVLTGGDRRELPLVAERMRSAVAGRMAAAGHHVTASVGVVSFLSAPEDESTALAEVDGLMYAAKTAGKDRVTHAVFGGVGES
jgi:diguanylate cyclase (GGDEF)-like protein